VEILRGVSSRGHYDLLHQDEEQYRIYLEYTDGDDSTSISFIMDEPPLLLNGLIDVDDAVYVIDKWFSYALFGSKKDKLKEFKKLIEENKEEIEIGNIKSMIHQLEEKKRLIDKEINGLKSRLKELGCS